MRTKFSLLVFVAMLTGNACADILPLDSALQATYTACVGIDDELKDLKTMAGINTAVSSVGVATAGGATAVGLVKSSKDKEIEELEQLMKQLRELEAGKQYATAGESADFLAQFNSSYDTAIQDLETTQQKLTAQSKRLGNWRTGLIATSAATNIAGAIVAGTGQQTKDLNTMIEDCKVAMDNLRMSIGQAQINGEDISEARAILSACDGYNYVDLSKITTRGKGALISSAVGATTGVVGTVTSAAANSNAVRNNDDAAGKQKEHNLNTAANVFSGATTMASTAATVFNATQISAIKKVASVAAQCTGVLK